IQCIFLYRQAVVWRRTAYEKRAGPATGPFVKTKSMKKKALTRDKTRRKGGSSHRTGGLKMRTALGGESNGTLSQRVYQALKKDIITGQYQPGEALSENALAKRYHGSRTRVREA